MRPSCTILPLVFCLAVLPAGAQPAGGSGDVSVTLELSQQFYYAGDPFMVRISVGNNGGERITNPVKSQLLRSFKVTTRGGDPLRAEGKTDASEPVRPDKLASKAFYGAVVDLAELFPGLREVGEYEIGWSADGLSAQKLIVKMLPKYDPSRAYSATLTTSEGEIVIDFLPRASPIAVKAFIDMANAGFYDGLLFHEVRANRYLVGGDPQDAKEPRVPFLYPAEQSSLPLVAGTVVMKPARPSPPANGSQFIILLKPEPAWSGQVTVLGQVVRGLDVAQKISVVSSTQQSTRPFFKPLKDVVIRKVTVEQKTPEEESGSAR